MISNLKRLAFLKRNISLYRLLLIFGGNGLTTSAIYFFFTSIKGLTSAESLFLIGVTALAMALAEVPTGVVADKFSRKYSLLIGFVILAVSGLCMLFATGFWPLLLLMIIQGIGGSFTSGADDALLYDSLKESGEEKDFKSIYNVSSSIEYVSFAITVLIGGILAGVNLYLPMIANIILLCISIAFTLLLTEPLTTKEGEEIEHVGYLTHMGRSFKAIFSKAGLSSGLLGAFIAFGLVSAAFKSTKNILSPILGQYGVSVPVIALLITIMTLIKASGGFIASKVKTRMSEKRETIIALILFITGVLAIAFIQIPLVKMILFILIITLDTVILTNLSTIVNEQIDSKQRSTILSLLSLFALSSKMLFLTSLGWIIDLYSFELALLFTAGWLAFPVFILLVFRTKHKQKTIDVTTK